MSKPSAPAAPNPVATVQAQQQSNTATALQQSELNNVNQVTPYGSLSYSQNGTYADGTPQYTQTESLSQPEQNLFNLATTGEEGLGQTAVGMLGQVQSQYANPIDYSGQPGLSSGVNGVPGLQYMDSSSLPQYSNNVSSQGSIDGSAGNNPNVNYLDSSGLPQFSNNIASQGQITGNVNNSGPSITGSIGNAGQIAGSIGYNGPGEMYGVPGQQNTGAAVQQAENAAYNQQAQYLNPQFSQAQEALSNSLINQGITQGSQAGNTAQQNLGLQENQAYGNAANQAVLAGENEQNTLYGQGLSSANLFNSAQNQAYGQAANNANFQNAAQAQNYSQLANNAAFQNAANAQGFSQGLSQADLQNAAQSQSFNQGLQGTQLANQNAQQGYQNLLSQNSANNAAQAQQYGQGVTSAGLQNTAQAQSYGQGLQNTQLANQNATQGFSNLSSLFGLNNTAQGQQYSQGLSSAGLQNSTQAQYLQQLYAMQNQPLNEFNALASGSQVSNPTFNSTPQTQVSPTNVGSIYNQSYQDQLSAAQYGQSGINNLFSLGGSLGSAAILASDRRLKRDIRRVGTTPSGIPTYLFRYNNSDEQTYFGVMADEVRHIPGAAILGDDGFYKVDYSRIP